MKNTEAVAEKVQPWRASSRNGCMPIKQEESFEEYEQALYKAYTYAGGEIKLQAETNNIGIGSTVNKATNANEEIYFIKHVKDDPKEQKISVLAGIAHLLTHAIIPSLVSDFFVLAEREGARFIITKKKPEYNNRVTVDNCEVLSKFFTDDDTTPGTLKKIIEQKEDKKLLV